MIDLGSHMDDLVMIRRDLHAHPELGLEEVRTSDLISRELDRLGFRVHRGLAKTGVVATLTRGTSQRALALRADIDALPISEETGADYQSRTPGLMHACGHDGHTVMLLGAARLVAERDNFDGSLHLIFQPAEENFGGARMMVEEGLFDRFPSDAVFGMHNAPHLPFGKFATRPGPICAAVDEVFVTVDGKGGHGAEPQSTADPILCGASIVTALQSIVARNISPNSSAVVTVGAFNGGSASHIIPSKVKLIIGVRSFDPVVRGEVEKRIRLIVSSQAESFGMGASIDYVPFYDPTVNHPDETAFVASIAQNMLGHENVVELSAPWMASEDFGYMLKACPGAYFFLGSSESTDTPPLHHPAYDFNDRLLPVGVSLWTELVENYLRK
ncbi:M20 aminoacylase family protein [Phyllobacterium sp. UNC302MFCol5.2]|uniref:M20 aminoacylase family protein n=1 Tax=Phyllobacterium sp. UNC302MFCol5.2 TaxID=1449065 RepID=UPI00056BA0F3|nr:M20 aminoacylase family protein [Phyllobacterium sp. UNC302MFCol5.2]